MVAEVAGPRAALALVDAIDLDSYYLFHAVRADLLRRAGRLAGAYEQVLARTDNIAEQELLRRNRDSAQ